HRLRKGFDELLPALLARRRLVIAAIDALDLQEPGRLAHQAPLVFVRGFAPAETGQECCLISILPHHNPRSNDNAKRRSISPVNARDHSMISSARVSSDGGTLRPSAFAVFRLITSSN